MKATLTLSVATLSATLALTGSAFAQSASAGCPPKAQQAQGLPSSVYESSKPREVAGIPSAVYNSSKPREAAAEPTGAENARRAQNASGTAPQDPCR